jgi:Transposase DDE domain
VHTTEDQTVAAGHSVVGDLALWQAGLEELLGRVAGRFPRVEPRRRARFGVACSVCPLRQACTSSVRGRVVAVHPQEAELAAARARQRDPAWLADYRATRPKVERKLAHLLRRRHGGRRARVRGLGRVAQDFKLLTAAVNLARLATLGLRSTSSGWEVQPA